MKAWGTIVTKAEDIILGDVYDFRYGAAYHEKVREPYHCFEGQLTAMKLNSNALVLRDSFCGFGPNSRTYTYKEALSLGTLTLLCNEDEVESLSVHDLKYYDSSDTVIFTQQRGCTQMPQLRKGAQRSQEKMIFELKGRISDAEHKISWAQRELVKDKEKLARVEAGDTKVYI